MTEETKSQILDYILNKVEQTEKNDDEIFLEQIQANNEIWMQLETSILPTGYKSYAYNFEGMVAGNELTTNLTVLYGGYRFVNKDNVQEFAGVIILVDENFNPIKIINKFNSGTRLRYIQYMKQDEDGTFYYIDDAAFPQNYPDKYNSDKRFVMTNNFTLPNNISGDYEVGLRKSYNLTGNYKNFYCMNMYSDPNSSHYIFFGSASNGSYWSDLKIFGLQIIVGASNEWTMYYNHTYTLFGSAIAIFEDGNVKFRCLCNTNSYDNRTIDCVSKTYTGNVSRNSIATFSYMPYIDTYSMKKQSVFLTYDDVYFVQNNQHWGNSSYPTEKHLGLYKYNFTNSTLQTIYDNNLGTYGTCNLENMYIDRCDTDIYVEFNNNISQNQAYGDYYIQRLANDVWQPKLVAENQWYKYNYRSIYIKSNFNLLQIFSYEIGQAHDETYNFMIKEDYNSLNYNGTSYIDYDSLISKKGQIYSDNKLVFARNLYNKYINNSTTMSTIQIPNNYLNGINLDLKKLISNTNFDICNEENITNKNIYEMMFVNYINTITCIDEDTNTIYGNTANYINGNINTGTKANYDNTKMSKVRINFTTPQIQLIEWNWNVDHYETEFTIYTDEIPTSIEFISNDETTTYITKELEFEQNKYYTISQKIRIE
jgi:hypothetical protein